MNTQLRPFFTAALVCLGSLLFHSQAKAQCAQFSLNGAYGYTVTGTIVAGTGTNEPPPLFARGPFAAVGRIVFDGKGGVTTVRTLSETNTVVQNDSGTGTYTVNSDCTGSFNITVGPSGHSVQLSLNFVLDGADEIRAIVTNINVILVFDARKQLPIYF